MDNKRGGSTNLTCSDMWDVPLMLVEQVIPLRQHLHEGICKDLLFLWAVQFHPQVDSWASEGSLDHGHKLIHYPLAKFRVWWYKM